MHFFTLLYVGLVFRAIGAVWIFGRLRILIVLVLFLRFGVIRTVAKIFLGIILVSIKRF